MHLPCLSTAGLELGVCNGAVPGCPGPVQAVGTSLCAASPKVSRWAQSPALPAALLGRAK